MLTKKVKSRIFIFILFFVILFLVIFFTLRSLEKNVIYFLSPTEINQGIDISYDKTIRIGGLVKNNSVSKIDDSINFVVTDLNNELRVSYKGLLPNLFAEGKGVVAEGKLMDKKYFIAEKIIAKHDENYMPPEVKNALEKSNN